MNNIITSLIDQPTSFDMSISETEISFPSPPSFYQKSEPTRLNILIPKSLYLSPYAKAIDGKNYQFSEIKN